MQFCSQKQPRSAPLGARDNTFLAPPILGKRISSLFPWYKNTRMCNAKYKTQHYFANVIREPIFRRFAHYLILFSFLFFVPSAWDAGLEVLQCSICCAPSRLYIVHLWCRIVVQSCCFSAVACIHKIRVLSRPQILSYHHALFCHIYFSSEFSPRITFSLFLFAVNMTRGEKCQHSIKLSYQH